MVGSPVSEVRRLEPKDLPFERVHGITRSGDQWLVGGLRGLALGKPGGPWRTVSKQAVKQIVYHKSIAWVLYGSGAIDKLSLENDRLYYDVMTGKVKRPWSSSLSPSGENMLIGGFGGWFESSTKGTDEHYPKLLASNVVTAITRQAGDVWIGTQNGLFVDRNGSVTRLGLGAGLSDLWVTSVLATRTGIIAGLADGGIVRVVGTKVEPIELPSRRVRLLCLWRDSIVVGTLDGTWLRSGNTWTRLTDVESTALNVIDGQLAVGTPKGVRIFTFPAQSK